MAMDLKTFKSSYTPDSSKWTREQKEFFSDTVRAAREDAMSKVKEDTPCTNTRASVTTAADCKCAFCAGALAAAEKVKQLTGYDFSLEKPTR